MIRPGRILPWLLLLAGCLDSPADPPVGVVLPAGFELAESSFDGPVPVDQVADLENRGTSPLRVRSASLEGVDAGLFALALDLDVSVSSGGVLPFTLSVRPDALVEAAERTADGELVVDATARLMVVSDGASSPTAGCGGVDAPPPEATVDVPIAWRLSCDFDDDGAQALLCGGDDCDDEDPERAPALAEVCDDIDHDCDGLATSTVDQDGDGSPLCEDCDDDDGTNVPGGDEVCDGQDNDCFGGADADPAGEVDGDGDGSLSCADCDDGDPSNTPLAAELCDGLDNDCSGQPDADPGGEVDSDGDGSLSCDDCDDADPVNTPGAQELCDGQDNDCSGAPDFDLAGEVDGDGDGFRSCGDCDDADASSYPGAVEVCDGVDNDCSGTPDFDLAGEVDADGDGSLSCLDCDDGDPANTPGAIELCDGADNDCSGSADFDPDGEVDADGDGSLSCLDCDDSDAANTPGGTELCDGQDNDCSGAADFDAEGEVDADGDGSWTCFDCDDADPVNTPGAAELCDGADNDCNGLADADADGEVDVDSDGSLSCEDCDDADPGNTPGAPELCDGLDNDCDGSADAVPGEDDIDVDGFRACDECDDSDAAVFPGAVELCNGVDDDCNGAADYPPLGEADADGDGFWACDDCDDSLASVNAGAPEVCSGIDDDCDGLVDEDMLLVPEDYGSVQAGIDAAFDGDVVCVGPGTYFENIDYGGVAAQVVGRGGSGATTLDGGGVDTVVRIENGEGPGTRLQGFVVTNGYGLPAQGGGLNIDEADVTLVDLVVTENSNQQAAFAVVIFHGSAVLVDVEVSHTGQQGRGLVAFDTTIEASGLRLLDNPGGGGSISQSAATLSDVVAIGNGAATNGGGGLLVFANSTVEIDGALFVGNSTTDQGGALDVHESELNVFNGRFLDNSTVLQGGVLFVANSIVTFEHCSMVGNSSFMGGVAWCWNASVNFLSSDLSFNSATGSGAAYFESNVATCAWHSAHSNFWADEIFPFSNLTSPVGSNGNTSVDSAYLDTTSSDPLDWDLHLSPSSPLIDGGDPLVLDPDGSPADIGAWSGPTAHLIDLDGDGAPSWWQPRPYDTNTDPAAGWDCDDLDLAVGPNAGCGP
jgi:hypothetical protein